MDAATPTTSPALEGRPTRVALVGTGYVAAIHADALKTIPDVELVAVCDVDRAKADAFARAHGIAKAFGSIAELAAGASPDVAHVLVPVPAHAPAARAALEAGIHVLVEKPMTPTAAEGRELAALARARGLRLGVNHNSALLPSFLRLAADVRAGRIGAIEHVVSVQNNPLRQLSAGDYGDALFADPKNIMFEQGPHPLSQIRALLGEMVEVVSLPSGRRDLPGGCAFFHEWQVSMRCERGTAQLFMGFGRDFPESWLHVIGQDGSIRVDLQHGGYALHGKTPYLDFQESWITARRDAKAWNRAASENLWGYALALLKLRPRRDPFFLGFRESFLRFHRALRSGGALPASAEDGIAIVEWCERIAAPAVALAAARPTPRPAPVVEFTAPRAGEVAVLGATGFIGGHVVERLVARGKPVRLLVRNAAALGDHLRHPLVRIVVGSLENGAALERAIAGCESVVHLASHGGDRYEDVERTIVHGSAAVADLCGKHGVKRLVYTSSVAALYFGGRRPITDATPLDARLLARSHYARAQIESERRLLGLHREKGLPVVILRLGVVVGKRGRPFHTGVGQWRRDTHCLGWGSGNVGIPFVLAGDVADAMALALEAPGVEGAAFNLAGDVRMTAREYVTELRRATARPIVFHPTPLSWTHLSNLFKWGVKLAARKSNNAFPSYRDLATRAFRAPLDCSGAKQRLGWRPESDRARFLDRAMGEGFPKETPSKESVSEETQ
jgi:predicted dehydrogenase/nucleoside-diphosphate-sugar epimerase